MKVVLIPQLVIAPLDDEHQVERIRDAVGSQDVVVLASDEVSWRRELADAEVLFGEVTPAILEAAPELRWVQSVGAGVDRIAQILVGRSVRLTGVRGIVGPQLAEHALALLLSLTRGVAAAVRTPGWEHRMSIRRTQWELAGRNFLVVGLGGTGRAFVQRIRAFDPGRIVGVEPYPEGSLPAVDEVVHPDAIDQVLPSSDVVVLTLPLTASNRGWFDADRIANMPRGSILINVSRGGLVRDAALVEALRTGHLYGAGLDVLEEEPPGPEHPIWSIASAVVTPHIAGGSPRRAGAVIDHFCENLRRYRSGEPLLSEYDAGRGF